MGACTSFLRNEDLNARQYFAAAGARKPLYRRNQYGGTIGAPIVRDRLFFFGGYQGQRQAIGVVRTSTVPTVAERAGNFAGVAHVFDPASTRVVNGKYVRTEFAEAMRFRSASFDPGRRWRCCSAFRLPTSARVRRTTTRGRRTTRTIRTSLTRGWTGRCGGGTGRLGATRTSRMWSSR